jgi:amino acid adenylation domain-containing protein/non-ribosomal peptide synthase protein (TIGR01720 family)
MQDTAAYETLTQALQEAASTACTVTCVRSRETRHVESYRELYENALGTLGSLQRLGVPSCAEVVLPIADPLEFLRMFWACLLGGLVPVPLMAGRSREHHLKFLRIWAQLRHPHVVAPAAHIEALRDASTEFGNPLAAGRLIPLEQLTIGSHGEIAQVRADTTAFIQFSSGSTGDPKGVVLSHRNLLTNIRAMRERTGTEHSKQVLLSWMPLTHDMGLIGFHLTPVVSGWNHVLMPPDLFQRDPVLWFELISEHRATVTGAPNFGFRFALKHLKTTELRHNLDLSCLRFVLNGAEPVSADVCRECVEVLGTFGLPPTSLLPVYGLAEAALAVTFPYTGESVRSVSVKRDRLATGMAVEETEARDQRAVTFVDLGAPVNGCSLRITGDEGEELPDGFVGHIQIRGESVSGAYYRQDLANTARTPDGWLDTGDLGFLRGGRLVVTGREKEVLFFNGQNFYPSDVERVVAQAAGMDDVRVAVAGCATGSLPDERIAAFVTFRGGADAFLPIVSAVKRQVGEQLGLPVRHVIPIPRIPRTTSGKVQRVRLAQNLVRGEYDDVLRRIGELESAARAVQRSQDAAGILSVVLRVWRHALEDPSLQAEDHFFERGGDSIQAAHVAAQVGRELRCDLRADVLFHHPVARDFAAALASGVHAGAPVARAEERDYYPVTPEQRSLYALQKAAEHSTAYNIPFAVRVVGCLDHTRLENSFRRLVARHEALRTQFVPARDGVAQRILRAAEFNLPIEPIDPKQLGLKLQAIVTPFVLERAPLFRAKLFQLSPAEHVLACDGHHSVLDGTSMLRLVEELCEVYDGQRPADDAPRFSDYLLARQMRAQAIHGRAAQFWQERFRDGIAPLLLPADRTRPPAPDFAGSRVRFEVTESQTEGMRRLAAAQRTTLFSVLLSVYFVLLARLSGQQDFAVATPFAGRSDEHSWKALGMFVRSVVLRRKVHGTFSEFVREVAGEAVAAFEFADYPIEDLAPAGGATRRGRLFETMFVFQNMQLPKLRMSGVDLSAIEYPLRTSKFDLTLEAWNEGARLSFTLEYSTSLFEKETAERFARYYRNLVDSVLSNPHSPVVDLEMMDKEEREYAICGFNQTEAVYPSGSTLHALIEEQARRTPEAPAVIDSEIGTILSYARLDACANHLAKRLRAEGLGPGKLAGVLLDRSPDAVVAVLAILKAGGAYLPLDPSHGQERHARLVKASGASLVITHDGATGCLTAKIVSPACAESASQYDEPLPHIGGPRDLAYVIYTSGTSGEPKGVQVEHRSLVNYLTWAIKVYSKNAPLSLALHTSLAFDLTVTSLFAPLISGGAVVAYPAADPVATLRRVVSDPRTEAVKLTPTHLKLLRDYTGPVRARCFIVGGENLETETALRLATTKPDVEIYNEYGPTEATVGCMIHRFDPLRDIGHSVPIGVPADNCQIYILDANGHPVPWGCAGEICISGDCLARGYLGDETLTQELFVPNPFVPGSRLYRTGDLARRLPWGGLEFLGRRDEQVKIRGHRVAPEEVRRQIIAFPGIREAAVVAHRNGAGESELRAYLVSAQPVQVAELRAFLSRRLPSHMIPAALGEASAILIKPNGKIDREALERAAVVCRPAVDYVPPATHAEQMLVDVWRNVLGATRVGTTDNFFELGGDSIKALSIASRAEENGLTFTVQDVLQAQTVAELVRRARPAAGPHPSDEPPCTGKLLTPMQHWFFEQALADPGSYTQSVIVRFKEPANPEWMRMAVEAVLESHEGLCSSYDADRRVCSTSRNSRAQVLQFCDLKQEEEASAHKRIREMAAEASAGFDISRDLLLRVILFHTRRADYLLLSAHHLVIDGVSWRILLQELASSYSAAANGIIRSAPEPVTAGRYALALAAYGRSERGARQAAFWEAHRPSSIPRRSRRRETDIRRVEVDSADTSALTHAARTIYHTDPGSLVIVALVRSLCQRSGKHAHWVDLEHHGRVLEGLDLSRTVGWLSATYPVLLEIDPESSIDAQIHTVKRQLADIPDSGRAYGILKYLRNAPGLQGPDVAEVRFNYLGEFGPDVLGGVFEYAPELDGVSDLGAASLALVTPQIDCIVRFGRLYVTVLGRGSVRPLAESFLSHLHTVIAHVRAQRAVQFAPCDFETLALEQREVDEMLT